jgi:hypothetical protein
MPGQIALAANGERFLHGTNGNVALGLHALAIVTGIQNVAVGGGALASNVGGDANAAVGVNSQLSLRTGAGNSALGVSALEQNQTGEDNTAVGSLALKSSGGTGNTAVGWGVAPEPCELARVTSPSATRREAGW